MPDAPQPEARSTTSAPDQTRTVEAQDPPVSGTAPDTTEPRSARRWWWGVFIATPISLPFSWLLSYGALLPFLIGLFFFALFGLVIGAVVYRVAAPGRPFGTWRVLVGTTWLVLSVWALAGVLEARDFPGDMAKKALSLARSLGGRTPDAYSLAVAAQVRGFLSERYPPGGTLGYMRWMLSSGVIKKGALTDVRRTLRRGQTRFWYVVRVVLSVALLAFGVGSQTLPLSRSERRDEASARDGPDDAPSDADREGAVTPGSAGSAEGGMGPPA